MGEYVRAHLAVVREPAGGYTATVLNLAGIVTHAETEKAAVDEAKEAVQAVVAHFMNDGGCIPWIEEADYENIPEGAELSWALVSSTAQAGTE